MLYASGYLVALKSGEVFTATATGLQHDEFGYSRVTVTRGAREVLDIRLEPHEIHSVETARKAARAACQDYAKDRGEIAVQFTLPSKG